MDQNKPNDFVESERGIILNESATEKPVENSANASEKKPKKHETKIVGTILFVLFIGLLIFAATQIDYTAITDSIIGSGYNPQGELAEIIEQLDLTDEGMRILKATRPELQDRDAFNASCTTELVEAVTLGCHDSRERKIYIYNVQNSELAGIHQSVLAHEFLHAVWARLSQGEKDKLITELDKIYDENEEVQKSMGVYQDKKDYNELHSVVGQTVRPEKMSETLRAHYAKYFKDHDKIVAFYEKYSEPFERARKRIEELKEEIETRRESLRLMQEKYNADNNRLTQDVNAFNACSEQAGCFTSVEQFAAEREALVARQEQMEKDYHEVERYIMELNGLIEEYNANVINNSELQKSINSKQTLPQTVEED